MQCTVTVKMNKRAYSSTASEGAPTDISLLDTSLQDLPKAPKQNKKRNKKKTTDDDTSGQKKYDGIRNKQTK